MTNYYSVEVIHNGKPSRDLKTAVRRYGLRHLHPMAAYAATTELSKREDVLHVRVCFMSEKVEGIWRNGKRERK